MITTVGATYAFLSLMTLYPDKQRKLQQEVDDVIGGRLPRLADRPKMHYMEAVRTIISTSYNCQIWLPNERMSFIVLNDVNSVRVDDSTIELEIIATK